MTKTMTEDIISHLVVPGTFDPVTFGHLDVIRRTKRMAARVTVAVAASVHKNGTGTVFTLDERIEMLREALREEAIDTGVEVCALDGLLVDFAMSMVLGESSRACARRPILSMSCSKLTSMRTWLPISRAFL